MSRSLKRDPTPLEQLGAGTYSGINSLAFGAPELIQNLVTNNPNSFKQSVAAGEVPSGIMGLKANDIGNVGGFLGSIAIPGGLITKALGAGSKALGAVKTGDYLAKAGDFLAGQGAKGIIPGAFRAGGQALEQAAPRALIGTANDVNQGESLPNAVSQEGIQMLASTGLGAGIGTALGAGGEALRGILGKSADRGGIVSQNIAQELKEGGAAQRVAGVLGTTTRALRAVANSGQRYEMADEGKAKAIEKLIQDQSDSLQKYRLTNRPDAQDLHDSVKESYNKMVGLVNKENTPVPQQGKPLPSWITNNTSFQRYQRLNPNWQNIVDDYVENINNSSLRGSVADKLIADPQADPAQLLWHMTSDDAKGFRFGDSGPDQQAAHLADIIHEAMNKNISKVAKSSNVDLSTILPPSFKSIDEMDKFYHDNAILRATNRIEATTAPQGAIAGSPTALRMASMGIGAGAGGLAGAATGDPNDPLYLARIAGGSLIGGMANQGITSLANKIGGSLGGKLNKALGGGVPENILDNSGQLIRNPAFMEASQTPLGANLTAARDMARNAATGVAPVPGAAAKLPLVFGVGHPAALAAMASPSLQGQQPMPPVNPPVAQGQPNPMAPMGQQDQGGASMVQQGPPPGAGVQSLQNLGQYGRQLQGKLMQMYMQLNRVGKVMENNGISPEAFIDMAARSSNGFDPTITANLLFPDESQRANFLKSYQQVQQLKNIDVGSIIGQNPWVASLGGSVLNGQYIATRQQLATIIGQGKPTDTKNAMNQIDQIQWLNIPVSQKMGMLAKIVQTSLGIDVSQVHQLGLDKGTILEALPKQ